MIQTKLLLMEHALFRDEKLDIKKFAVIQGIRKLLMQIDFNAEVVPMEDSKKLNNLLESIKGKPLTNAEIKITDKLINK